MPDQYDVLKTTLRKNGYSLTKARRQVFAALVSQEPQTIQQLAKRVSGVNRASVYRIVSVFEKLGIVQRLQIGWKYKLELSDTFHYHHHHLSCVSCGAIVPLREDVLLEANIRGLAMDYGYKPVSHQLEVSGLCPECRKHETPA